MNGKEIVDLAASIVNRQEANTRSDILAFVNSARLNVLRNKKITRLRGYKSVPMTSGVIDMETQRIKSVRMIEYVDGASVTRLNEIYSRQAAMDIYKSFSTTGTPSGYLVEGTSIYILPVPTAGTVSVAGEFWPADITDSVSSSDITIIELGDAWAFLGAGLYMEIKGDPDNKSQKWQQRGMAIVDDYIDQGNTRLADTTDVWRRWPFGKPLSGRRPATTADTEKGSW